MLISEHKLRYIIREELLRVEQVGSVAAKAPAAKAKAPATKAKAPAAQPKAAPAAPATTAPATGEFFIFPRLAKQFPTFDPKSLESAAVVNVGDSGGIKACSRWAAQFVGHLGNAWHSHNYGDPVKYSAYSNISAYKAGVEKLLTTMNLDASLKAAGSQQKAETWNNTAHAIGVALVPSPATVAAQMQYGDIVGLYHPGSSHYAEALFDAALSWSLELATDLTEDIEPGATLRDGSAWSSDSFGSKKDFTVVRPFGMNTHIGFVGAMYKGQPVVFHNVGGTIFASIASKMNTDKPVWVKSSKFSRDVNAPSFADKAIDQADSLYHGAVDTATGWYDRARKATGL